LEVGRTSEPDLCEESPLIGLLPKLNTDLRPCVMAWKELYLEAFIELGALAWLSVVKPPPPSTVPPPPELRIEDLV
jgi:hypothetical protein